MISALTGCSVLFSSPKEDRMSITPGMGLSHFPKGRRWKKARYPGGPDLSALLYLNPDEAPADTSIRSLSGFGISLMLNRRLEPGSLVLIDLVNSATACRCQLPMRVVASVAQPDEQFLVEGAFGRELRNAEVLGLLPEALG
jgi:hypothetical protein